MFNRNNNYSKYVATTISYQIWFAVFFIGMGLVIPQVSPYVFTQLNINNPGVIFLAGQIAMPVGALIAGYISDKTLHIRYLTLFWTLGAVISLAAFSRLPWNGLYFSSFESIKLGAGIFWSMFMFSMGGIIPLINVSYLQNGFDPERFGRIRLFGTLGFALPNAFFSFGPKLEPNDAILWAGFFMALSVVTLFLLPEGRKTEPGDHITLQKAWRLLKAPLFIFFLIISLMFYFSFSAAEYVVSNFVLQKVKNAELLNQIRPVYFIWLLGTLVEIYFFFISPALLKKYSPLTLMAIGLIAGILRYEFSAFFKNEFSLLATQALHGIQFAGSYLGALLYLKQKANPRRLATAQALYTTFGRSIGTGGGSFILGNLAGVGAYVTVFHLSAAASLTGLVLLAGFSLYEKKFRQFTNDN